MSMFGDRIKELRKKSGMTLDQVAKKIGSHKGYVSGIENDKVNPPSPKVIKKYAKIFDQDEKELLVMAWVDKAPDLIKPDLVKKLFSKERKSREREKEEEITATAASEKPNDDTRVAKVPAVAPENEAPKPDAATA